MRYGVLNKMVVLVLRYLYSVNSYWPKSVASQHIRRFFLPSVPQHPVNIDLGACNLHWTENSEASPTHQIWCF